MAPSFLWKLALAIALAGAIIVSASARAPRKPLPTSDLRWLLLGAAALYAVGLVALAKHRGELAVLLLAAGVAISTLTAWLSRGIDAGGGGPRRDEPIDEWPPPDPDEEQAFDWVRLERELLGYVDRERETVASR